MSAARQTLAHVASRLAPIGRVRISWHNTLDLDGRPVLFVNQSDALIYSPVTGPVRHLRAMNATPGESAADIASAILGRLDRAGVAPVTERSAA